MIKLKSILESVNLHKKTQEDYNGVLITAKTYKQSNDPFGVTEKDLQYMENWPLSTKNKETYAVVVKAEKDGRLIAKTMLGYWGDKDSGLLGDSVYVLPHYRKRGIANKMYDVAERHTGTNTRPGTSQTPMGKAMWKKRMSMKK